MNTQSEIVHALRTAQVEAIPSVHGDVFCPEYGWLFLDPVDVWKHALMNKALRDGYRVATVGNTLEALMTVSGWQISEHNARQAKKQRPKYLTGHGR